jgi:hypothetical protein
MILDAGNSIIKAKSAIAEIDYPHALHLLSETDYKNIMTRSGFSGPPPDYMEINGKPYVFGESAERHGTLTRRSGAARYTGDYYGLIVAGTLARLFTESLNEVAVFGSHAPGDVAYREDLMRAAAGEWHVKTGDKERVFRVNYANTFDEPVGGLMNVLLSEDGLHYSRNDIKDGHSLVIDIGGHTTDWLAVNPGGDVDYSLSESTPIGIQDVMKDFERSFRARYRAETKHLSTLPPARVRQALMSGMFSGGGREFPCQQEVDEAANLLINRVANTYQQVANGPVPWDTIVLTGGGSALLHERLLPVLNHQRVELSESSDKNHLANVRGGLKLWKLYQAHGLL